jgi:hypothetical protein
VSQGSSLTALIPGSLTGGYISYINPAMRLNAPVIISRLMRLRLNKTKMKGFKSSKAFEAASKMPTGLVHKPDEDYDPAKSEVVAWLISQPEIQNYLFSKCNTTGALVFDQETKTWRGKDS